MLFRMIREIKSLATGLDLPCISFYVAKVFSESITLSSSPFTNVWLFAIRASYAIDDSSVDAHEMIASQLLLI